MKKIAILGSTGSIGTQTLDVVRANGDIEVLGISAGRNVKMLEEQGVNNSLFARIAVTLFKKDKKQRTPEQDEKLIAELEKMVDEYEAQIEEKSKEK